MSAPAFLHLSVGSQLIAEHAVANGFTGVVVDMQHGEHDLGSATRIIRSVPDSLNRTLVRVPGIDSGAIGAVLDAGAGGIIAPCVESAEQARAVVAATKFAPVGARSLGPQRPGLYQGPDMCASANASVRAYVQIESALGVERRREILTVAGLDGVYIGPADLALTMGHPPRLDWEDGPVKDAIDLVVAAAREAGVDVGIFSVSGEYARRMTGSGQADFVGLGSDVGLVARATQLLIGSYRA